MTEDNCESACVCGKRTGRGSCSQKRSDDERGKIDVSWTGTEGKLNEIEQ
jgi:hypothetical protein